MKNIMISLLFGFALGYITFISLDEFSTHKANNSMNHMELDNHSDHQDMSHVHGLIEVDSLSSPQLQVDVYPDAMSGYNLHIITDNYLWVPESVNSTPVQNEGHAHVYVNDEKVARVYGPWFHLDNHHLTPGENMLRVTLNAHNHDEWSVLGVPIEVIINLNEIK